MTYEELLAKIDNLPEVIGLAEFKVRHDALRAIVELHKPFSTQGFEGDPKCLACSGLDANDWPCLTIQAIEKELT